jgi:hypothetical protein
MNKALTFGAGLGLGTGLMYLLDPDRGRRRRALLRDKGAWALRKTGDCIEVTAHDLRNRAQGITHIHSSSEPVDDRIVAERVRSKLGRVVAHPGAIEVNALNGAVTLSGPILVEEMSELLKCVNGVRGVKQVINNLEAHEQADNHPALQGGRERQGAHFEFFQENWSPAARVLAAYGGVRRDALGAGLGTAGLLLLTRGITNTGIQRLAGFGSSQEA